MLVNPGGAPVDVPIIQDKTGMTRRWKDWFIAILIRILAAPYRLASVAINNQSAAIVATALPTGDLVTGMYRISWYARLTQAATTSSSFTLTIGYTDSGVALTTSGAAIVSNLLNATQVGSVLVPADVATSLTYAVAYASVGGVVMKYKLNIFVEAIPA